MVWIWTTQKIGHKISNLTSRQRQGQLSMFPLNLDNNFLLCLPRQARLLRPTPSNSTHRSLPYHLKPMDKHSLPSHPCNTLKATQ